MKAPYIFFGCTVLLLLLLFFGFETVRPSESEGLKEKAEIETVLLAKKEEQKYLEELSADELAEYRAIEEDDEKEADLLKSKSAFWSKRGMWGLSADYAYEVALMDGYAQSWEIAASTALFAARQREDKAEKYADRALQIYEKLMEDYPESVDYEVNRALVWTDFPPEEQPMKGVMELLDLQKTYPGNSAILYHLGRLGIRTGQYDKALVRLENAYELSPRDSRVVCLLAQLYRELDKEDLASQFDKKCEILNKD